MCEPSFPSNKYALTDGTGTTQYSYVAPGSLGALRLYQETSPLAYSTITYGYYALGRLISRNVPGAGTETFGYDAIGRLTNHISDLGAFTLSYLGQTRQITGRSLPNPSTLATTWSYLTNTDDRRLSGITNVGLAAGQSSAYAFTTTPENFISAVSETSDTAIPSPTAPSQQTASYNLLNELRDLSGQILIYDANGNLLSDGSRTYAWDAENRLVTITYPGSPGKETAFTYDGLSRRTAIASTPAGGGTVTTAYLWCGSRICQTRNASNAATREYYAEGEYLPGAPAQPYYYGIDQTGTMRRVFASASSAPAYAFDPYGNPLQVTAPLTDFTYAGLFYNPDSGLYLTQYRAYDPVAGRWLSRDPTSARREANRYVYVNGIPTSYTDPTGLLPSGIAGWLWGGMQGLLGSLFPPTPAPSSSRGPSCPAGGFPGMQSQGAPPPNLAPPNATRDEALDAAKAAAGVPPDATPEIVPNEGKNPGESPTPVPDSEILRYLDENGDIVDIRHDYGGADYPDDPSQNRGPHFNTPTGGHYDYTGPGAPYGYGYPPRR